MKVVFFQSLNDEWKRAVRSLTDEFPDVSFITDKASIKEHLQDADIIIGGKIDPETVKKAKKLQAIILSIAGVNHLPFDYLKEHNIRAANSHGNARSVAEHTVSLILSFYGRVIEFHNDLRNEIWHGFWVGQNLKDSWESIYGKTACILGTGEIGTYTARFLKAFDVKTIGFKRAKVDKVPEYFDEIVFSVKEAISKSEIVIVALPSTGKTKGLIDKTILSEMKGKILVNVGRGDIVDEEALFKALETGTLRGAAIDCWYTYPAEGTKGAPSRYPIHKNPNVVISPHIAGFSSHAASMNIKQTIENLRRYLLNREFLFEVNLDRGY